MYDCKNCVFYWVKHFDFPCKICRDGSKFKANIKNGKMSENE